MKHKNYTDIANIIKDTWDSCVKVDAPRELVHKLANYFEREDIQEFGNTGITHKGEFNKKEFLKNCGVE